MARLLHFVHALRATVRQLNGGITIFDAGCEHEWAHTAIAFSEMNLGFHFLPAELDSPSGTFDRRIAATITKLTEAPSIMLTLAPNAITPAKTRCLIATNSRPPRWRATLSHQVIQSPASIHLGMRDLSYCPHRTGRKKKSTARTA